MSNTQLCEALRVQGLCHYLPCAEAADRVEAQEATIGRLKAGLYEALEWNWLDEDAPEETRINLNKLLNP